MKIINKTKQTVLANNAILANTAFKRLKGLLGRKSILPGEALILKPANSIHTMFMRFSIDLIFLDKKNVVVKIIHSMIPFRFTALYLSSSQVIELPSGVAKSCLTAAGDQIVFE